MRSKFYQQNKNWNFKPSGLETDKDNFKVTKTHIQEIILTTKKCYFEEDLAKYRNKQKELCGSFHSLDLSSDKANKSKFSLKKLGVIQFKALKNVNLFEKSC